MIGAAHWDRQAIVAGIQDTHDFKYYVWKNSFKEYGKNRNSQVLAKSPPDGYRE